MSNHEGYGGAHLMLAFLAGAAAGVCTALLGAPRAGTETRETLRGWAKDAQGRAVRVPDAVRNAYSQAAVAAKEAFVEAMREPAEEDGNEARPDA